MIRRLLALLATTAGTAAAQGPSRPGETLLLADVAVIDGRGGPPVADRHVLIRDGRIAAVVPAADTPRPPADRVIELAGATVLPGLIDTHLHLPPDRSQVEAYLQYLLRAGITTARDMAGDAYLFRDVARAARDPASPLARLEYVAFWAGPGFFAADRRPRGSTQGGEPGAVPWFLAIEPDTDLDAAALGAVDLGAHGLKLYSDLPLATFRHAIAAARGRGLRVATHAAVFPVRPGEVVASGVDAISHAALLIWEAVDSMPVRFHTAPHTNFGPIAPYAGVRPDNPRIVAVLQEMARRGTILDATLATIARGISPAAASWATAVTALAHRLGVPISTGTDRPEGPSADREPGLFDEIEHLVREAGLTPLAAITAATWNGARVLGLDHDRGTVAVGRAADLVVTRGDPSTDITELRRPVLVLKAGRPLSPTSPGPGAPPR